MVIFELLRPSLSAVKKQLALLLIAVTSNNATATDRLSLAGNLVPGFGPCGSLCLTLALHTAKTISVATALHTATPITTQFSCTSVRTKSPLLPDSEAAPGKGCQKSSHMRHMTMYGAQGLLEVEGMLNGIHEAEG